MRHRVTTNKKKTPRGVQEIEKGIKTQHYRKSLTYRKRKQESKGT